MKIDNKLLMKTKYIGLLAALLLGFTACESDDDSLATPLIDDAVTVTPNPPSFSSGTADFSTFVAIGNSLTAGFSDGALFAEGQDKSFPNILAHQFALAGGGAFTQPLMNDNAGGLLLNGAPVLNPLTGANVFPPRFYFDAVNQVPLRVSDPSTTDIVAINPGPYNNMGVPGAKSYHLIANGYGDLTNFAAQAANPYFIRMASSPTATVLGDAVAKGPSFFSLWIGSNDVLGYATSGGVGADHNETGNLNPLTYGGNDITNALAFNQIYNGIVQTLVDTGADGILTNIPDVTVAPYFTTVPYAPLDPSNPDFGPSIPTLNTVFGALNQVYAFLNIPERSVVFSTTQASPVVIRDESLENKAAEITAVLNLDPNFPLFVQQLGLPPQAAPIVADLLGTVYGQTRQANAGDLLILPSSSVIGTVNADFAAFLQSQGLTPELAAQFSVEGITHPLDDRWVLIPQEQADISEAIVAFNQVISDAATAFGLPLFDANAFIKEVAESGYQAGSAFLTADFVTGGAFSLDGIHPSPRGNAVVANKMIEIINQTYGSNIPTVNPIKYTGLYLN